jgi:hypothetical protein
MVWTSGTARATAGAKKRQKAFVLYKMIEIIWFAGLAQR